MKPAAVPLDSIRQLAPACLRVVVPESYRDENGHMNIRWYLVIFDDAGYSFQDRIGLTREYHRTHETGTFDLEHHIHYLNEVMPGDTVSVHTRFLTRTAKRIHYMMFMIDETRGKLAAIFECINSFADLKERRTAPYPPEIAENIDALLSNHSALAWEAPVCGVMGA